MSITCVVLRTHWLGHMGNKTANECWKLVIEWKEEDRGRSSFGRAFA